MIDLNTIEPGTVIRCIDGASKDNLFEDKLYIYIGQRYNYAIVENLSGEKILRANGRGWFPNRFEVVQ